MDWINSTIFFVSGQVINDERMVCLSVIGIVGAAAVFICLTLGKQMLIGKEDEGCCVQATCGK